MHMQGHAHFNAVYGLAGRGRRSNLPVRRLFLMRGGFTLVELLMVLVVMSVMLSLSVVAFNSLVTSQGIAEGLTDLSSLIEFSKTQAVARNTYVRVGFLTQVNGGSTQLFAGAVGSQDGTTNLSANNLYPISKILQFKNMRFTDRASLGPAVTSLLPSITPAPAPIAPTNPPVSFTMSSGGVALTFTSTITITPQGEIMMSNPAPTDPYISLMEIGIQSVRGTTVPANAPAGMLWIYGSSGQTQGFH